MILHPRIWLLNKNLQTKFKALQKYLFPYRLEHVLKRKRCKIEKEREFYCSAIRQRSMSKEAHVLHSSSNSSTKQYAEKNTAQQKFCAAAAAAAVSPRRLLYISHFQNSIQAQLRFTLDLFQISTLLGPVLPSRAPGHHSLLSRGRRRRRKSQHFSATKKTRCYGQQFSDQIRRPQGPENLQCH